MELDGYGKIIPKTASDLHNITEKGSGRNIVHSFGWKMLISAKPFPFSFCKFLVVFPKQQISMNKFALKTIAIAEEKWFPEGKTLPSPLAAGSKP